MSDPETALSAHEFTFTGIDGQPLPLSAHAGHPVLIVNTASECGFTPQYEGLEALWQRYRKAGLVVIAVPSNDFGAQEPGSETEIAAFCSTRFNVSFPMTRKEAVIGPAAHPFYRWVEATLGEGGTPKWNFHKYLIDGEGQLAETYASKVAPLDPGLTGAIEERLG